MGQNKLMRKIFILGGSYLQLDLILEAKKLFFYTIVIDRDKNCIGASWCDEFLHINISDKEAVLAKAQEYNIDVILTSATELGNTTACWVGEKLGLNTNSYQTSLNTTNKLRMKRILEKKKRLTARHSIVNKNAIKSWDIYPCIVKPSDSSAGRGLSYCKTKNELKSAINKGLKFSQSNHVLIEEYIEGTQFSIETISCNSKHQIVAINHESIRDLPHIIETSHTMPALIEKKLKSKITLLTKKILDDFRIKYGACHIEIKVTSKNEIYIIELASRTGGMRSEMVNLAFGLNYSQLLLLSALKHLPKIRSSRKSTITCNFIVDNKSYQEYLYYKKSKTHIIFEPLEIKKAKKDFMAAHLGESKGYYFLLPPVS
jgi:biotin carboxylase